MKIRASDLRKVLLLSIVFGCGGLEPVTPHEPVIDPALLYMALTLDHEAINLSTVAPYRTIQLTATPRDALGQPMTGLPPATFRSSDTTALRVTADGFVEALQEASGVAVIAELAAEGNVRHADTAFVNVSTLSTPPVLASLSIQPVPPDSAVRGINPAISLIFPILLQQAGVGTAATISARVFDTSGAVIPGLAIEYRSLDPSVGQVGSSSGQLALLRPGQMRVVAGTTAYGVSKSDTIELTITLPIFQVVQILPTPGGAPRFGLNEVRIRPNGFVFWLNTTGGQPVDITFDNPTSVAEAALPCHSPRVGALALVGDRWCGAGNIEAFGGVGVNVFTGSRVRQFPEPGVYPYRSTLTGATGRVVVAEN